MNNMFETGLGYNLKRFRYSLNKWEELKGFGEWLKEVEKSDVFKSYLVDDKKDERKSSTNPDIPNSEDKELIYKKIKRFRGQLARHKYKFQRSDEYSYIRYKLPPLYLKLQDYKGGVNYIRWFDKNYSDDDSWPEFLFECAIILFKNGEREEAIDKLVKTFYLNDHIFAKFFGRALPIGEGTVDDYYSPEYLEEYLKYTSNDPELVDFSEWLLTTEDSEYFKTLLDKYCVFMNS